MDKFSTIDPERGPFAMPTMTYPARYECIMETPDPRRAKWLMGLTGTVNAGEVLIGGDCIPNGAAMVSGVRSDRESRTTSTVTIDIRAAPAPVDCVGQVGGEGFEVKSLRLYKSVSWASLGDGWRRIA